MSDDPNGSLAEGYAPEDGHHWICKRRSVDLSRRVDWQVVQEWPLLEALPVCYGSELGRRMECVSISY